MTYDVALLFDIAESANIPNECTGFYHEEVTFIAKDGWRVVAFYDGNIVDYIDRFITPEGITIDAWKLQESKEKAIITSWTGLGDRERLESLEWD